MNIKCLFLGHDKLYHNSPGWPSMSYMGKAIVLTRIEYKCKLWRCSRCHKVIETDVLDSSSGEVISKVMES